VKVPQVHYLSFEAEVDPGKGGIAQTDLARKRRHLWKSVNRNEFIVRTALAMTDSTDDSSVAILVESAEHGNELLRSLPGWELLAIRPDEFTIGRPVCDRTIATISYAAAQGIAVKNLIRADGGAGWPLPQTAWPPSDNARLFDLVDRGERRLAGRAAARRHAYEAAGWCPKVEGDF
jgi:hypothetical protein